MPEHAATPLLNSFKSTSNSRLETFSLISAFIGSNAWHPQTVSRVIGTAGVSQCRSSWICPGNEPYFGAPSKSRASHKHCRSFVMCLPRACQHRCRVDGKRKRSANLLSTSNSYAAYATAGVSRVGQPHKSQTHPFLSCLQLFAATSRITTTYKSKYTKSKMFYRNYWGGGSVHCQAHGQALCRRNKQPTWTLTSTAAPPYMC